jgi:hypothetical protein
MSHVHDEGGAPRRFVRESSGFADHIVAVEKFGRNRGDVQAAVLRELLAFLILTHQPTF